MSANTLTLTMEGTVSLADYATALTRLQKLLDALGEELAPGVPIHWEIVQPSAPPRAGAQP